MARTSDGTAVLLKDEISGKSLPIFLNSAEARLLLKHMRGMVKDQKNLHSYIDLLWKGGNFALKSIEIRGKGDRPPRAFVRAGRNGEDDFTYELSPCDALILSVIKEQPVLVEAGYFSAKGVLMNVVEQEKKNQKKRLEDRLNRLVEREEYEEAALVRDKLIELQTNQE
ncbi:MAG: DUF151 domain-containing protein [Spirochaetales bacterium]|nr:DUF151 domain-containing protein [Spirochaetales bacterium]